MIDYKSNSINTFWKTIPGKAFIFYLAINVCILLFTDVIAIYKYNIYLFVVIGFILALYTIYVIIRAWEHTNLKHFTLRFFVVYPLFILLIGWPTLRTIALASTLFDNESQSKELLLIDYRHIGAKYYGLCLTKIALSDNNNETMVCSNLINIVDLSKKDLRKAKNIDTKVTVVFNTSLGTTIVKSIKKI